MAKTQHWRPVYKRVLEVRLVSDFGHHITVVKSNYFTKRSIKYWRKCITSGFVPRILHQVLLLGSSNQEGSDVACGTTGSHDKSIKNFGWKILKKTIIWET
jgi:hypothetical protein